jgi:type IV secretion system protein VirB4
VIAPVLTYLFHRLEARFTGRPTLLILDEAWVFLDHPLFAARIREWLKVLRKKNVSVVFATQSLADIAQSTIAPAISRAARSASCCPMTAPSSPRAGRAMSASGLSSRIELISRPARSGIIIASARITGCSGWGWGLWRWRWSARPIGDPAADRPAARRP